MNYAAQYFKLAQAEETAGNKCAALLLYLSSFCDSFNSGARDYKVHWRVYLFLPAAGRFFQ